MTSEFSLHPGASRRHCTAGATAVAALLALPWLWPFAPGPAPNVVPLLASGACLALAALLAACTAATAADLRRAVRASWLLAALASACIGLAQWFGVAPASDWISAARLGEAYGNLRQRNHFASLTSIGLAVLLFTPGRDWRWLRIAAVLLLAAANAASASRTGLLQWLLLGALVWLWPGPRRERAGWWALALAGYGLACLLLQRTSGIAAANVFERALSELGCSSRRVLWDNVLHLVAQRPWTGWGWGELDYAHFATLYPGQRFCDILDNAHNLPLHLAVELGVPAALGMLALAGWLVWRAQPWRASEPQRQLAWAVLAAIGLHSLLEYPLWYGPFQLAVLLCLLLLTRGWQLHGRQRGLVAVGALAALLALGALWRAYDKASDPYRLPQERQAPLRLEDLPAAGRSGLFRQQVRFAELSLLTVDASNAHRAYPLALELLHYSPEPMVAGKLVESALLLGDGETARWALVRFRAAFPEPFQEWLATPQAAAAARALEPAPE